ncbi:hypothetical protein DFP72DRAFT_481920 [Ephemerocybe angulata]|uniref:SH3 domain-containing protein n=1 Tax=Ephemerocybe angulata TaxID=980116 RepID=A0A8H6MGH8_9AGAR|nr:hypothetical protein DFP72DRAFT_481920 [Tulosesus angulatus]
MHQLIRRRHPDEDPGLYPVFKRVPQVNIEGIAADSNDVDAVGENLLPQFTPITITVTRTIFPVPDPTISTTMSTGDYNHNSPYQPMETLVPTTMETTSAETTTTSSTSTQTSTSTPRTSTIVNNQGVINNDGTPNVDPVSGNSKPKKMSTGVLLGVIILCLFLVIAVVIFFVRRRYVRRRQKLRKGWKNSKLSRRLSDGLGQNERKAPLLPTEHVQTFMRNSNPSNPSRPSIAFMALPSPSETPVALSISAPPPSFGNETAAFAPPTSKRQPSPLSKPPIYGPPITTTLSQPISTVVSTFITTLPDELSITIGEAIRVLAEYDDGWALCLKPNGQQGMVPMECLDGRFSTTLDDMLDFSRGVGGNRRRVSSLQPATGNIGRF